MPKALISAATRGTITIGMDNCWAMAAAWMPPAPPPATRVKSRTSWPFLVQTSVIRLAMTVLMVVNIACAVWSTSMFNLAPTRATA